MAIFDHKYYYLSFDEDAFRNRLREVEKRDPEWIQFEEEWQRYLNEQSRLFREVEQLEKQKNEAENTEERKVIEEKIAIKSLKRDLASSKRMKADYQRTQRSYELDRDMLLQEMTSGVMKGETQRQLEEARAEIRKWKKEVNKQQSEVNSCEERLATCIRLLKKKAPQNTATSLDQPASTLTQQHSTDVVSEQIVSTLTQPSLARSGVKWPLIIAAFACVVFAVLAMMFQTSVVSDGGYTSMAPQQEEDIKSLETFPQMEQFNPLKRSGGKSPVTDKLGETNHELGTKLSKDDRGDTHTHTAPEDECMKSLENFSQMNEIPKMEQLYLLERSDGRNDVRIIERIGANNHELGTKLLEDDHGVKMQTIEDNARGKNEKINHEIFRRWLTESRSEVNWKVLLVTLIKVKFKQLACDIVDALNDRESKMTL